MGFSERIDITLNWTELKEQTIVTKTTAASKIDPPCHSNRGCPRLQSIYLSTNVNCWCRFIIKLLTTLLTTISASLSRSSPVSLFLSPLLATTSVSMSFHLCQLGRRLFFANCPGAVEWAEDGKLICSARKKEKRKKKKKRRPRPLLNKVCKNRPTTLIVGKLNWIKADH